LSALCTTIRPDPALSSVETVASRSAAKPPVSAPATGLLEHARLLDSVAAFTHLRDIAALDHSLALSLAELVSARSVALCKRSSDSHGLLESIVQCTPAADGSYRVRVIEPDAADPVRAPLQRCLESMQAHAAADGPDSHQLIVPILRDGRAIAALQIDGAAALDDVRPLVDGFVRIYANYTALLNESERDKLTGLYNRRTFDRHLQRLLCEPAAIAADEGPERERRGSPAADGSQLWLAIIDIDHFKRINDSYGHIYGDEVILLLAQLMRSGFRHGDVPFRFGGEEFVVLLRAEDEATAHAVMERFRRCVAEYRFPQVVEVTVSIGHAHVGPQDYPATVLDRADKALYFAKEHGRNRVAGYEGLCAAGELGSAVVAGSIDLF
jgi:diguanylate cyclase (GGDEF)-like protein